MPGTKGNKNAEANSKYKPEYNDLAYKFTLLGADDKILADYFDVCEDTINNWKKDHPSFFESIKKGKDYADAHVSESLYKRATGYEHPEDQIFQFQGEPIIVPTIKHYPPDATSMIYWLKNRRRKSGQWQDKPDPGTAMYADTIVITANGKPLYELKEVNDHKDEKNG